MEVLDENFSKTFRRQPKPLFEFKTKDHRMTCLNTTRLIYAFGDVRETRISRKIIPFGVFLSRTRIKKK